MYDYTYDIVRNLDISILPKKKYHCVISISDPKTSHIAVSRLKKQGLVFERWIQYWGDPMTHDITSEVIYPLFIRRVIEEKLLKQADRIAYVSPLTLIQQKKEFPKLANKMVCCLTPFLEERISSRTNHSVYMIGYYGSYMSVARNILPFYEACCMMKNELKAVIIGDGDVKLVSTDNISVLPRGDVQGYEDSSDLLICILNRRGTQIPGKIYHYAATNKPILVITDGNCSEDIVAFLKEFDRYYFCENTAHAIFKAILDIMKDNREWAPCKAFSSIDIARKLIEVN
jgi:hypothetical protein